MSVRVVLFLSYIVFIVGVGYRWVVFYGLEFLFLVKFNFSFKGVGNLVELNVEA